jgi:hypothetical protein
MAQAGGEPERHRISLLHVRRGADPGERAERRATLGFVTDETRTDDAAAGTDAATSEAAVEETVEDAGVTAGTSEDGASAHVPAVATNTDVDHADLFMGATSPEDREWTHDPLERSFFSAVGRGYVLGILVLGLFGFLVTRAVASGWGMGAAIGVGVFVAVWAGVLGAVVMVGRWAMRNEEMIRGNESGHGHHEEPVLATSADEREAAATEPAGDEAEPGESEPESGDVEAAPPPAESGPPLNA